MITISFLIQKLKFFIHDDLSRKAIALLFSHTKLIAVEYTRRVALNEFEIHKKSLDKASINYFGINELIGTLKMLEDEKIIIVNCCGETHILKIFFNLNHDVIGAIGLKKRNKTPEEIEREMYNFRLKY